MQGLANGSRAVKLSSVPVQSSMRVQDAPEHCRYKYLLSWDGIEVKSCFILEFLALSGTRFHC